MNIQTNGKNQKLSDDDTADEEQPAGESKTPVEHFSAGKIGGNILSLGSSEIIARLAAFVGTAYAARRLGPEQFGIVGFALALFSYISVVVSGGFNDVGSREVARRPGEASSIAANVIVVRLAIALIGLALLGTTVWFLDKPPTVKLVVLLTGLLVFSLALDTSWVYKGLERNHPVSLALILSQILYAGAILLTVNQPRDVAFVPLAQFLGEICAALMLTVPLFWLGKIKFNWREGFDILRGSSFSAVSRLMRAVMYSFDVVLIGFWIGEEAVGRYSAPYRICFLLVAIAASIYTSYLPTIIRVSSQDDKENQIGKIAERSLSLAAAVGAPLVVGGIIVAAPLLETVFGSDYTDGADAFKFLLLSVGFVFLHGANHNIFLAVNRLKTEMMIFAAAAAVNIGLNIFIIPRYGIVGAAFVTAAADALTLVLGLIVINQIGVPFSLLSVWRPLLASAVMGAVLLAMGTNHSLILYLATGGIVYLLVLALLRGIPPEARPLLQTVSSLPASLWR
jgi:O-antigen/teichoic acid export membrane protein